MSYSRREGANQNGYGHGGRRRNYSHDSDDNSPRIPSDIPFIDANPDLNEIPLSQVDNFIIPARDDKGIAAHITFNLPPFIKRQIQIIVRSHRFPYLDVEDFIRHAIVRHIPWCVNLRHSLPKSIIVALEAVCETARDNEYRQRAEEAFKVLASQVNEHEKLGEYPEIIKLLTLVRARIDDTEQSSRQRKFKKELDSRYGHYLKPNGMVRDEIEVAREVGARSGTEPFPRMPDLGLEDMAVDGLEQ